MTFLPGVSEAGAQTFATLSCIAASGATSGDSTGSPATIAWAGSYNLGESILSVSNGNSIEITGNDVTLDLHGFSLWNSNSRSKTGRPAGG